MSKKFGKILLGLTAAGAAGAGAYYWLKNRHEQEPEDEFEDDFEDEDFELDDDLGEVAERGYTSLTPSQPKETTDDDASDSTSEENDSEQTEEPSSDETVSEDSETED